MLEKTSGLFTKNIGTFFRKPPDVFISLPDSISDSNGNENLLQLIIFLISHWLQPLIGAIRSRNLEGEVSKLRCETACNHIKDITVIVITVIH